MYNFVLTQAAMTLPRMINRLRRPISLGLLLWSVTAATAQDQYTLADGREVGPLDMFQDCAECPEMIVLPMGSFVMGAPLEESVYLSKPQPGVPGGLQNEGPEHDVLIDVPIAMGRNEVTRAEFLACVTDGGCTRTPDSTVVTLPALIDVDDPRHPVISVSYIDMLEYVSWLNNKIGTKSYRLPTEAEWEYAAHGGTDTRFGQGDSLTRDQANIAIYRLEGDKYVEADLNNRRTPVLVDMLDSANPWGLRHMAGNVWELTMSCWSKRHLGLPTSSAYITDEKQTESCPRVTKGGSYGTDPEYGRPAYRTRTLELHHDARTGFRIIKEM